MTSKWRERLFSPTWSTGERVYVLALWTIILVSLTVLVVIGVYLYHELQAA
jgi:hypothetical protein